MIARDITVTFAPTPLAEAFFDLEWPRETRLRLLSLVATCCGSGRAQRCLSASSTTTAQPSALW